VRIDIARDLGERSHGIGFERLGVVGPGSINGEASGHGNRRSRRDCGSILLRRSTSLMGSSVSLRYDDIVVASAETATTFDNLDVVAVGILDEEEAS